MPGYGDSASPSPNIAAIRICIEMQVKLEIVISIEKGLRQMAWADEKIFSFLSKLPREALKAKINSDDWNVAGQLFHLIASADWYNFQLGQSLRFTAEPESIEDILKLGNVWQELNNFLIAESLKKDEELFYIENEKSYSVLRSSVLTQAVIHAVEHRILIVTTLKINGFPSLDLEDFSIWAYQKDVDFNA